MDAMAIGEAAARLGVSVGTMRRWEKEGRLSPAFRTLGGQRRYTEAEVAKAKGLATAPDAAGGKPTVIYARVSTSQQKDDLARQSERLRSHCAERGWERVDLIEDVGSGLNYGKRGLRRLIGLICARGMGRLVIERKDRLLRFGAAIIFSLCAWFGIDVVVIEDADLSFEESLAQDVLSIITVFSAKIHGARSLETRRRKKAEAAAAATAAAMNLAFA